MGKIILAKSGGVCFL